MKLIGNIIMALVKGKPLYYIWIASLIAVIVWGGDAFIHQCQEGLILSMLSDSFPWGFQIANFVFLVGVAAGAVTLIIPAYFFGNKAAREWVFIGEALAIVAVIMALLCILTDIGHIERLWHLIPPFGILNLPSSLLSWDVLVVNGYLIINIFLVLFLLWKGFYNKARGFFHRFVFLPVTYISILWAFAIHSITAYIFSSMVSRPYWNNALMAPKFIATALATDPVVMILVLLLIAWRFKLMIHRELINLLAKISFFSLGATILMVLSELFFEFYSGTEHSQSALYWWVGLSGHSGLPLYSWGSFALMLIGFLLLPLSGFGVRKAILIPACIIIPIGIWIEKGIGVIIPAYVPNNLGKIYDYWPNIHELMIVAAIWALGLLLYTLILKVTVPILKNKID